MPRKVSREQFIRSASAPKKRYASFRVSRDGKTRLADPQPGICFWFERHAEVMEDDNTFITEGRQATVGMLVDGRSSVLFYLDGSRLQSCTFAFDLRPHELEKAAKAMKAAGLGSLVAAAAAYAFENMPAELRRPLDGQLQALARKGSARTRRPRVGS